MPRGRVGGATAALIEAVAQQGVTISRYQVERWRAAGLLPRVRRSGRGRGKGCVSAAPNEHTIVIATMLGRQARKGARGLGGHVVDRIAMGIEVSDQDVRAAFAQHLDWVAEQTSAAAGRSDAGWQARHEKANRTARELSPLNWRHLMIAASNPSRPLPEASLARRRAAAAALTHALGAGAEALADDFVEAAALFGDLNDEQVAELRQHFLEAELRGDAVWDQVMETVSVENLRRVVAAASTDQLRRSIAAVSMATSMQALILLLGVAQLGDPSVVHLQVFDKDALARLEADPFWTHAQHVSFGFRRRTWTTGVLTETIASLLTPGMTEAWESYRDMLSDIARPTDAPTAAPS